MNRALHHNPSRGAALLIFIVLFLVASTILVYGITRGVYKDLIQYRILEDSKESFFAAEAGIEDLIYRHRFTPNKNYSDSESFTVAGVAVTTSRVFSVDRFLFDVEANAYEAYRKEYVELVLGNGASFSFGLQADNGGILMQNSSSVRGNVYANGQVVGTGGGSGNLVKGSVISAGPTGLIDGVHSTGSAWAHDIVDSTIDGDAKCDSIDNSVVGGFLWCNTVTATIPVTADFPGPPDQATSALPIADSDIEGWKLDAAAGEIIASTSPRCSGGEWVIDSSTTTGPAKIECDVSVEKNGTVWSLQGPISIEGNLTTRTGTPHIEIDSGVPALLGKSIQIIVDDPSDRSTGSQVTLENSSEFYGYGDGSYILVISQNNDEELGGTEYAINSQQSANGDILLYAGHGRALIEQSGEFIGIAALLIHLQNSAEVIYEVGAVSLEFPSGPGGGFNIGEWEETI